MDNVLRLGFRLGKKAVQNVDPTGLTKVVDGIVDLVEGVSKFADDADGMKDIFRGTKKIGTGFATTLGFMAEDTAGEESE